MPEFFDLTQTLTRSYSRYFVENRNTLFLIDLADGPLEIEGKWLFFAVILWKPLLSRKMPIYASRHLLKGELFDKEAIQRIYTEIYRDILDECPHESTKVRFDFQEATNRFHNDITMELGEYVRGIDMVDIAKTLAMPEIKAATDFRPDPGASIQKIETLYKQGADRVMATVSKLELRDNAFYPFVKLKALNAAQFPQVIMAGGPRTDVDDTMITRPILGSYARGFRDIIEYAIDSRAAAKSEWYNASTMGTAQYSNRKKQLLSTGVRYIYPGDCETTVSVPFFVVKRWSRMLIGKFICEPGNNLVELTFDNIHQYHDRVINMRSPLTCRYQDGFCRRCGGRLVDYLPPGVVPGIAAEHEVMAPIAQLVLSNKHVAKTRATTYILPGFLRDQNIFEVTGNEIYIRPHVDLSTLVLGMPFKTVERLSDLQYVIGDDIPNDHYFTDIIKLVIGRMPNFEIMSPLLDMTDDNKNYPHFSGAALHMIRNHPEASRVIDDLVWIKFEHFDRNLPIMYTTVVNDSTRLFVKRVEHLFTKQIKEYTSLTDILQRASTIVWRGEVYPHIMHLEVCIKSNLITNDVDFSIPMVTDPNDVQFGSLAQIIPRRSIGPQIAYEAFNNYITDPSTFIFPKGVSLLDGFLGFNDT